MLVGYIICFDFHDMLCMTYYDILWMYWFRVHGLRAMEEHWETAHSNAPVEEWIYAVGCVVDLRGKLCSGSTR